MGRASARHSLPILDEISVNTMTRTAFGVMALAVVGSPCASQSPLDSAATVAAFEDYLDTCPTSARAPWPRPVCGPLLGVHAASGFAVATVAPPMGEFTRVGRVWVGRTPAGFAVSNTATEVAGTRFATVILPLPNDRFRRTRLLAHEEFHRIQPALGLQGIDRVNPHLDEPDGRIFLRLELRALSVALALDGPAADSALRHALLFRDARYARFPGADTLEAALERHEGLAEYTGTAVALGAIPDGLGMALADLAAFERRPTYVRSLGYGTGPALGLLLDRVAPGWQQRDLRRGMAGVLRDAVRYESPRDLSKEVTAVSRRYGGLAIRAEEEERAAQRARARAEYQRALVDGPVLVLEAAPDLYRVFNPNTLIPLDGLGTVYPTGTFSADWGKLTVTAHGALVHPTNQRVQVALTNRPEAAGRRVEGTGWVLELSEGWRMAPGTRSGDWTVRRER